MSGYLFLNINYNNYIIKFLKSIGNQGDTGPKGDQGIKGDQGDKGNQGDTGPKGDQGIKGDQGDKGNDGATGPIGPTGNQGDTGPKGDTGDTGPKGDQGATGNDGSTGPTGPQGWSGKCLNSFLRSHNDIPQSVDLEQPVLFNKNTVTVGDIYHVPLSGDFLLETVGYYQSIIKVFHEYSAQVGLFLNGVLIPGSVTGEPAIGTGLILNSIIKVSSIDLLPNTNSATGFAAVLQLRNHSSYISPITLNGREGSGSDLTQINAAISIIQLCNQESRLP